MLRKERGSAKKVIPSADHAAKIAAAAEARGESDMVIIARTDARAELGIDEAIRRGHEYYEAGADVVFIEAPQTKEEFRIIRSSFDRSIPLFANVFEGTPFHETIMTDGELEELGYDLVVYPMSPMFASVHAMKAKLLELKLVWFLGIIEQHSSAHIAPLPFAVSNNFAFRSCGVTMGADENKQPMTEYNEYLEIIGLGQFREMASASRLFALAFCVLT